MVSSDLMARTETMLRGRLMRGDLVQGIEQNIDPSIQRRIDAYLQLYGAWVVGGCVMASYIWDGLKTKIWEPTQYNSDTLAKYCILRTSYTFLRGHPDFSQRIGEGEQQSDFYLDMIYPLIHLFWPNDLERSRVFRDYLILDSQFAYDLQGKDAWTMDRETEQRPAIESLLFFPYLVGKLRSDVRFEMINFDVPIDVSNVSKYNLFSPEGKPKLLIESIGEGQDGAVALLEDWPSNWSFPAGKIPPNLFADSKYGTPRSKTGGGCASLIATSIMTITLCTVALALFFY